MQSDLPHYRGDPRHLKEMFALFPSGVVALVAEVDGEPKGMVASSFTVGVSIDPPLVSCAIQRGSSTWPLLRAADRIGISVMAEDHGAMARQIASKSPAERFAGIVLRETGSSARFLAGASVWFEASLTDEFPAGDHVVALLEVHRVGADPALRPLVFYASKFHQLHVPQEA